MLTLVAAFFAARCTSTAVSVEPSPLKCNIALDPTSTSVGAASGFVTFGVSTAPECEWAPSTTVPWITEVTPARGQGPGQVRFRANANVGPARTGTLTVTDKVFTVMQASGCSYTIMPSQRGFGPLGGSAVVNVSAGPGCTWTAEVAADSLAWIAILSGTPGSGDGAVAYAVAPLFFGSRVGTITIAGRTFTVTQSL